MREQSHRCRWTHQVQIEDGLGSPGTAGVPHLRNFARNTSSLLLSASSIALKPSSARSRASEKNSQGACLPPPHTLKINISNRAPPISLHRNYCTSCLLHLCGNYGEYLQSETFNETCSLVCLLPVGCTCCRKQQKNKIFVTGCAVCLVYVFRCPKCTLFYRRRDA